MVSSSKDFVQGSTSVFKICKFRRNNRALNMQCAIYANSKSPHCCVVNCGQDDKKMTARSQKWGLLPVMFAEPLFQVGGHKISEKYYTWYRFWFGIEKWDWKDLRLASSWYFFLLALVPWQQCDSGRYGKDGKGTVRNLWMCLCLTLVVLLDWVGMDPIWDWLYLTLALIKSRPSYVPACHCQARPASNNWNNPTLTFGIIERWHQGGAAVGRGVLCVLLRFVFWCVLCSVVLCVLCNVALCVLCSVVLCVLLCSLQYAVQFKERRLKIDTRQGGPGVDCNGYTQQTAPRFETIKNKGSSPKYMQGKHTGASNRHILQAAPWLGPQKTTMDLFQSKGQAVKVLIALSTYN